MIDFKKIRLLPKYSKLRSIDVASIHRQSADWLLKKSNELQGQKNIFISYYAPSIKAVPEQFKNDVISASYA